MLGCPDVCGTCDLLRAPIFTKLSPAARRRIPGYSRPKVLPAGQVLFEKGDPVRDYFYIRRGLAEVKVIRSADNQIGISLAYPGDILGVGSFVQMVYEYSAEALTPLWTCAIKVQSLKTLLKTELEFKRELETRTVGALFDRHVMASLSRDGLVTKIAELIFKVDTILRAMPIEKGNAPRFPLTEEKVAEVIGASRGDVFEALEVMAQAGAVIRDGPRLKIGNRGRLRTYCPGEHSGSTLAQIPSSSPTLYGKMSTLQALPVKRNDFHKK